MLCHLVGVWCWPDGGATRDLNQREKSACYACRHTLRGGNLGLPEQEPWMSDQDYTWYKNVLLEQGIQFDLEADCEAATARPCCYAREGVGWPCEGRARRSLVTLS